MVSGLQYILLASLAIFLLEWLTGQLKGTPRREFGLTALCFLTNSAVTRPLSGAFIGIAVAFVLPANAGALEHVPLWIAYPAVFALMEFAFYWVHRLSHRMKPPVNWLWKIHRTHHSATNLNVSVTIRQNIFWTFVVPTTWIAGLSVYLGQADAAGLAIATTYAWNLFTHTHYRWDDVLRRSPVTAKCMHWLQHVIVSPSMHHTHHGYGKDGKMYKNFAVTLAIFDTLFGSLYLPEGRPAKYGVPGSQPYWAEEAFYPAYQRRSV